MNIVGGMAYFVADSTAKTKLFYEKNQHFHPKKPFCILFGMKISKFLTDKGFRAITLGHKILLFDDFGLKDSIKAVQYRDSIVLHEVIHVLQIEKHGLIGFHWTYFKEYMKNMFKGKRQYQAYADISFEQEARSVEKQLLQFEENK